MLSAVAGHLDQPLHFVTSICPSRRSTLRVIQSSLARPKAELRVLHQQDQVDLLPHSPIISDTPIRQTFRPALLSLHIHTMHPTTLQPGNASHCSATNQNRKQELFKPTCKTSLPRQAKPEHLSTTMPRPSCRSSQLWLRLSGPLRHTFSPQNRARCFTEERSQEATRNQIFLKSLIFLLMFFFRICSPLRCNNGSAVFKKLSVFSGCIAPTSSTWGEQRWRSSHSWPPVNSLLCSSSCRAGAGSCQVNKHTLVTSQTHFHLVPNSGLESWFNRVKC